MMSDLEAFTTGAPDSDNSSDFSTISPVSSATPLQNEYCNLSTLYGSNANFIISVGKSFTFRCSGNIGKTAIIRCLPNSRFSMTKKGVLDFCYWKLQELHYMNRYALFPFAVLLLTASSILLMRSKMYNSRRQMRLRLYTWLIFTLNLYCTEQVIYSVTIYLLSRYRGIKVVTIVCAVHVVLSRYLLQVAYLWLFNVGLFLCWSILHPLNPWSIKMWHLKIIAFTMPLALLGPFFIILGHSVKWKAFNLCYIPRKVVNLTYLVLIPSVVADLSGYVFVYLIVRRMHSYHERSNRQRLLSYYKNLKNIYKRENSVKKFFWLFLLLGHWRIIDLIPIWELSNVTRANFVTIRETIVIICFCLITIPVCFKNPDVQAKLSLNSFGSLASHIPSLLRHAKLSLEPKRPADTELSDLNNKTTSLYKC